MGCKMQVKFPLFIFSIPVLHTKPEEGTEILLHPFVYNVNDDEVRGGYWVLRFFLHPFLHCITDHRYLECMNTAHFMTAFLNF